MSAELGHHYIAGNWIAEAPNGVIEVENPSNGTIMAPRHGSAALAIRLSWLPAMRLIKRMVADPRMRATALMEFVDLLESRADEIATLMARENGKVLAQARHEVAAGYGEADIMPALREMSLAAPLRAVLAN